MPRVIIFVLAATIFVSCTKKIFLAPGKVNCNMPDKMQCFLIKDKLGDNWILSSEDFIGFDYQPGYQYKVKVKRARIKRDDGTKKSVYEVIEVLEKIEKKKPSTDGK